MCVCVKLLICFFVSMLLFFLKWCSYLAQVSAEEESYQNKLRSSLKSHPHHILHLHHPLLLNNLLPCDLEMTSVDKFIGPGERIALDKIDRDDGVKLSMKVGLSVSVCPSI